MDDPRHWAEAAPRSLAPPYPQLRDPGGQAKRRPLHSGRRETPFARAGKPSPFCAPSNAPGCPRMPVCSRANFLPFFAIRCATIASCWRRLRSLNQ